LRKKESANAETTDPNFKGFQKIFMKLTNFCIKFFSLVIIFLIIAMAALLSGCSNTGAVSDAQRETAMIERKLADNGELKSKRIGEMVYATGAALRKEAEPSLPVQTAISFNDRAQSLAGFPDPTAVRKLNDAVNFLTSKLSVERSKGEKMRREMDAQNIRVVLQTERLRAEHQAAIGNERAAASAAEAKVKELQKTVDRVNSWFGLGAIFYGFKRFITVGIWLVVAFILLFLALKVAAQFSPITAGLFKVFEAPFSILVSAIGGLMPGAITMAGHVPEKTFRTVKSVRNKIVDVIEEMKVKQAQLPRTAHPNPSRVTWLFRSPFSSNRRYLPRPRRRPPRGS